MLFDKKMQRRLIITGIILLLLGLAFWGGRRTCPGPQIETHTDTLYVYDTITKVITKDHYTETIDTIFYPDSILIPADVDTAAILADYYRTYKYDRSWGDSTISVNFSDYISRNRITRSTLLNYKLLKPQSTIINTTNVLNYQKYINIGLRTDITFLYPEFQASYIGPKFSYGLGYMPRQKALTVNFGYNILKFK